MDLLAVNEYEANKGWKVTKNILKKYESCKF
jgi:hypothetical protein